MTDSLSPFDPLIVLQSTTVGRFAIEREIGRGGMGVVYLAREFALDRPVAIKMLPPLAALSTVSRERFVREAKIAASLSHPNILPVYSFEDHERCSFFVMAYVDGETLEQRVNRDGPLDAETAMQILREVAWALDHAHLRGIVHRDVKPSNIMLERDNGRALVMDYGIAHGPYERLTASDAFLGTVGFASPEQATGAAASFEADIYGLGATAWFVLSGSVPQLPGGDSLLTLRVDIPKRVVETLAGCLAPEPSERPESAGVVAESMSTGLANVGRLPGPLKDWITAGRNLTIPLLIFTLYPFMRLGWPWFMANHPEAYILPLGIPWAALAAYRTWRLLLLSSQGYGIRDIRNALHHWRRQRNNQLATAHRKLSSALSRTVRWFTYASLGTTVTVSALEWLRPWPEFPSSWQSAGIDYAVLAFNLGLLGLLAGWVWPRWASPQRDVLADLRTSFWDSRFGALYANAGKALTGAWPSRAYAPPPLRLTEVSLHDGVASLYARLEPSLQKRLDTLPAIATALERRASEIRQAIGRLRDLESSALPPSPEFDNTKHEDLLDELVGGRASLEKRRREVVAALEDLRLGLMRLVARAEMSENTTAPLSAAEDLAQLLRFLDDAQRAVKSYSWTSD